MFSKKLETMFIFSFSFQKYKPEICLSNKTIISLRQKQKKLHKLYYLKLIGIFLYVKSTGLKSDKFLKVFGFFLFSENSIICLQMIRHEYSGVYRQTLVFYCEERSYRSREFPHIESMHEATSGAVEQQHPAGFVFKQNSCKFSLVSL